MPISDPQWFEILYKITDETEKIYQAKGFNFEVFIEEAIVQDVAAQINRTMKASGIEKPNPAKIAGVVSFWIRKLKPLIITAQPQETFRLINELVALKVGLAICDKYMKDENGESICLRLNKRILRDWVASLRYHSHSPHSSIIAFEMLACEKITR